MALARLTVDTMNASLLLALELFKARYKDVREKRETRCWSHRIVFAMEGKKLW
jgi:hypothetical protein